MIQVKKILFPTSCSENATKAFRYTLAMAKFFGSTIDVLHVCEPNIDILVPSVTRFKLLQEQKKNAEKMLVNWLKKFDTQGFVINLIVELGFAKETIASYANKQQNIDLIAIGTKDYNGLTKLIWGTIISQTVESAQMPILVIPKGIVFQQVQNIAYLTASEDWRFFQPQIEEIAKQFSAKLYITHLPDTEYETLEGEEHIVLEDYASALQIFTYNARLQLLITTSSARNNLLRILKFSKAQKMALKATIPLLVLKAQNH